MLIESFKPFLQKQAAQLRGWLTLRPSRFGCCSFPPWEQGKRHATQSLKDPPQGRLSFLSLSLALSYSVTHEKEEFLLFFCFRNNKNNSWHARNDHRRGLTRTTKLCVVRSTSLLRLCVLCWKVGYHFFFTVGNSTFFRESLSSMNNNNGAADDFLTHHQNRWLDVLSDSLSRRIWITQTKFLHLWRELLRERKKQFSFLSSYVGDEG